MNVLKIQTDILKILVRGGEPIYTTEKDGRVGLCPDSHCVVFCPNKDVYLKLSGISVDAEKVLKKVKDAEYRLSETTCYYDHILEGKKVRLMKVMIGERSAFINEKYTKYFDKNALYYVTSWSRPVCVYEYGVMVGMIFPILLRDGEK